MALLNNGYRHATIGRMFGLTAIDGGVSDTVNMRWNQSGRMDNCAVSSGYGSDGGLISYPDDMNAPSSYHPMQMAGRMSAQNSITGSGQISSTLLLTVQALANIAGSGDAAATGGLIVQLLADLSGSGEISDADMKAFLLMFADIAGQGDIDCTISALANMASALNGTGGAQSTLTGTGAMSADILAYGDLTPEGIRDSIWGALSSQYIAAGTMGEKLNDAGAAGNPWAALLAANNDPNTFGALMQALNNLVDELHKIQGLDAASPMTVTPNIRMAGDVELAITGDGTTNTTVTRV